MEDLYDESILSIAKRENNNNKRKFLVVNELQGKYLPVVPSKALEMFKSLAIPLKEAYSTERILCIGFAETATAIGAAVAIELGAYYIQTTREDIPNVEFINFTEAHSHATNQKLVKQDLENIINEIDRIIFVEDEVTTGNTIMNIINIIQSDYSNKVKFAVASITNCMQEVILTKFEKLGIGIHYLIKTDHSGYTEAAESYRGDGIVFPSNVNDFSVGVHTLISAHYEDARRLIEAEYYDHFCQHLSHFVESSINLNNVKSMLVLGTEEFMYPALYVASKLEKRGKCVKFCATGRSPIEPSTESEYPFKTRYNLKSMYDEGRNVFLYYAGIYDCVLIMTDAEELKRVGVNTLINALAESGNENIKVVKMR